MSSRVMFLCAALLAALVMAGTASAHPSATVARPVSVSSAESRPPVTLPLETGRTDSGAAAIIVLTLTILGGLHLVAGRQHAARVVALSLLLIFSGFEGAMHSVHHLDDTAAQCRVASSAEHVSVIEIDGPRIGVPSILTIERPSLERRSPVRSAGPPPSAGRAPPV